ncbi:MAG TPA: hypothetical protein VK662_01055 [Acidothermaceae bacterium]|jgi:hypothetical protein|nr:hypothetical protein [Acidothermaceae bacterium]
MSTKPFGVVHFFPGGTSEQYEASIAAVHPGVGELPAGQLFHAAGASPGGWTIIAVHETAGSWEKFRDTILLPRMQQGIDGGFSSPPQETTIGIYKVMSAGGAF